MSNLLRVQPPTVFNDSSVVQVYSERRTGVRVSKEDQIVYNKWFASVVSTPTRMRWLYTLVCPLTNATNRGLSTNRSEIVHGLFWCMYDSGMKVFESQAMCVQDNR